MSARPAAIRIWHLCLGVALTVVLAACAGPTRSPDYSSLASNLQAKGHLRTATAPEDVVFTAEDLAQAFEKIVFRYEFHFENGRLVNEPLEKPLKRWSGHIRYRLTGDAVTEQDAQTVAELTGRLSRLTGLSFERVTGRHDMLISIASRKGRKRVSRNLKKAGLKAYRERYDIWRETPGWVCGATLSSDWRAPGRLVYAHVFIGAEATGVLRRACLHEEIAQSLGLTNDSPDARPSIFNDDQEFALLTRHDALLMRALYDQRLSPGMGADEAMPIARRILAELAGSDAAQGTH